MICELLLYLVEYLRHTSVARLRIISVFRCLFTIRPVHLVLFTAIIKNAVRRDLSVTEKVANFDTLLPRNELISKVISKGS